MAFRRSNTSKQRVLFMKIYNKSGVWQIMHRGQYKALQYQILGLKKGASRKIKFVKFVIISLANCINL